MDYVTEDHIRTKLDRYLRTGSMDEPRPVKRDIIRLEATPKPHFKAERIQKIVEVVSRFTNISPAEIRSRRRTLATMRARHMVYYLARNLTPYSLPNIGQILDRDHCTLIHGINNVTKNRTKFEPELSLALNLLNSWGPE